MTEGVKPKRVKLSDVADAAGVSISAVSLAVRGEPGVSEETRQRVVRAAERLGYRGVRRTSARRSDVPTIGLVIKAPHGDSPKANHFYSMVLAGIEEACRNRGANLLFATMPVDAEYYPVEVPRLITERACDGLVMVGAHISARTAGLLEDGPAVVLVDAYAEDEAFDAVVSDNMAGARMAVAHLVKHGHREIVLAGTRPDSFPSVLLRRRGYEEAMAEANLVPRFADGPHMHPTAAAEVALGYVKAHREVTAVVCGNDEVAVALIRAAQREGIDVPNSLSVIGYDDIDLAAYISPQLTTLSVDKIGMGRMAVAVLLHRFEYGTSALSQTLLRPRLVERESVATIGAASKPAKLAKPSKPVRR